MLAWNEEVQLLAGVLIVVTAILTVLYVRDALSRPHPAWPKLLYAASIPLLYATFFFHVGIGWAVFTFAHAIEYIAFVNFFARKKYRGRSPASSPMAWLVHRQLPAMVVYMLVAGGGYWLWSVSAAAALHTYIVATGFLHFIYDGWIWKDPRARALQAPGITPTPTGSPGSGSG